MVPTARFERASTILTVLGITTMLSRNKKLAPVNGLEPITLVLTALCSTIELYRNKKTSIPPTEGKNPSQKGITKDIYLVGPARIELATSTLSRLHSTN